MPTFIQPISSFHLTSKFGVRRDPVTHEEGEFHNGLDLAAPTGTPVMAAASGVVKTASYKPTNGNYILIDHGDGWGSYYLHLSRIDVKPGQRVGIGQTIGAVGATGKATGPHLHFMLVKDGKNVDPGPYILGGAAGGLVSAAASVAPGGLVSGAEKAAKNLQAATSAVSGWGRFLGWGLVASFVAWLAWRAMAAKPKQIAGPA